MRFKIVDPEELSFAQWGLMLAALVIAVFLFCNWLNIAIWPY
jgi:hypothetical protein